MIGAILVVCVQILSTYTGHGVDYIGSYIMEEESLYFSERYAKDPLTPLPKTAFLLESLASNHYLKMCVCSWSHPLRG